MFVGCDGSNRLSGKSTSFRRQKVPSTDLENFLMHKYCDRERWPPILCWILIIINPGHFWGSLDSATGKLESFVLREEDRANVSCEPLWQILPKWNSMGLNRQNGAESTDIRSTRHEFQQWLPVEQRRFRSTLCRSWRKVTRKDGCHGRSYDSVCQSMGLLRSSALYVLSIICIMGKSTVLPLSRYE